MALHLLSFKETRSSLTVHNTAELHTAIFKGTLRRLPFLKGISNLDSRCGVCPPSFRGLNNCVRSCPLRPFVGHHNVQLQPLDRGGVTGSHANRSSCDNSSEWMRKSYGIQWLGVTGSESKDRCAMWKMCFLVHVALRSYVGPDLLVEKMAEDFVIHAK